MFSVVALSLLFTISSSLFFVSHPLSLAGGLIFYSVLVGLFLGTLAFSWLTYLLVLVFLGGVMVLVVYMTTLAANEKLVNMSSSLWPVLIFFVSGMSFYPLLPSLSAPAGLSSTKNVVISLFEAANTSIYLFSVFYLLLALVCVVKVIKLEKGPLVKRS